MTGFGLFLVEVRKWATLAIVVSIVASAQVEWRSWLSFQSVQIKIAMQQEAREEFIFRYRYPPAGEEKANGGTRPRGFTDFRDNYDGRRREGLGALRDTAPLGEAATLGVYEPGGG